MSLNLPEPIAAYFAADKSDGNAMAQCFTEHAVVTDEEQIYRGRAAISQWRMDGATQYNYTSEPIAVQESEGKIVVTSHVVGDFPGSPVDLRYAFVLEGDMIAELEITG